MHTKAAKNGSLPLLLKSTCLFLQQSIHHQGDAVLFGGIERAVFGYDIGFILVEVKCLRVFNGSADLCAPHNIIDGSVEVICQTRKNGNIGFYAVVFVLVDGLLADTDRVGQPLLADAVFPPKNF